MHKKILIILPILFLVVVCSALIVVYVSSPDEATTPTVDPLTEETSMVVDPSSVIANEPTNIILIQYRSGDYAAAAEASLQFAEDTANESGERLSQYNICIKSSKQIGDTGRAEECFEKGVALAKTIDSTNDVDWEKVLTDEYTRAADSNDAE